MRALLVEPLQAYRTSLPGRRGGPPRTSVVGLVVGERSVHVRRYTIHLLLGEDARNVEEARLGEEMRQLSRVVAESERTAQVERLTLTTGEVDRSGSVHARLSISQRRTTHQSKKSPRSPRGMSSVPAVSSVIGVMRSWTISVSWSASIRTHATPLAPARISIASPARARVQRAGGRLYHEGLDAELPCTGCGQVRLPLGQDRERDLEELAGVDPGHVGVEPRTDPLSPTRGYREVRVLPDQRDRRPVTCQAGGARTRRHLPVPQTGQTGAVESSELDVDTSRTRVVDLTRELEQFCAGRGDGLVNAAVPTPPPDSLSWKRVPARIRTSWTRSPSCCPERPLPPCTRRTRARRRPCPPALVSPSVTVPVIGGRPAFGTWQSLLLVDLNVDNHGGTRALQLRAVSVTLGVTEDRTPDDSGVADQLVVGSGQTKSAPASHSPQRLLLPRRAEALCAVQCVHA